jgi:hypothetical protein
MVVLSFPVASNLKILEEHQNDASLPRHVLAGIWREAKLDNTTTVSEIIHEITKISEVLPAIILVQVIICTANNQSPALRCGRTEIPRRTPADDVHVHVLYIHTHAMYLENLHPTI